jgi:hypothetical protein
VVTALAGPHLHIRRCPNNTNRALAKSRFPRSIPVPQEAVTLYADYVHERDHRLGADDQNPLVFVNLYRPPLGKGVTYQNAKEMFDRLAAATRGDRAPASVAAHRGHDLAAARNSPRHGARSARPRQPILNAALPPPERDRQACRGRARLGLDAGGPMNTPALTPAPSDRPPIRPDHHEWVDHLRGCLAPDGQWRPGEFDPVRWLFTGDPDNPMTTSARCRVRHCDTVVTLSTAREN